MKNRLLQAAATAVAAVLATVAFATPARADTSPGSCVYVKTLATDYIYWGGATAASVKQMYGTCGGAPRNWTYIWVWQSFADTHNDFWVEAAIRTDGSTANQGWVVGGYNVQEINSNAVATTTVCTTSYAKLHWSGNVASVSSPTRVC